MQLFITLSLALIFFAGTANLATPLPIEATQTMNDEIARLGMELQVSDPPTRLSIISRLGATRNPRAIDPLLKAMNDQRDDFKLRQAVITALGDIQDKRAIDTAIEALQDSVFHVRRAAAETLGKLGDKRALGPLFRTFGDKEATVRVAAVDSLATLGEPAARIIYENMYKGIDASTRLPPQGNEQLYDYLIEASQYWDANIRETAVRVLGRIKHEKIMDFLIRCLKDQNSYVSTAAIWSLQKSLNPGESLNARATEQLILLLKHLSPIVREAAAYTLGDARRPDPVPSLMDALSDEKAAVREAAIWSLFKIKDQRAIKPLCVAVADPEPLARRAASAALGELEVSPISFEVLVRALHDKNEEVA